MSAAQDKTLDMFCTAIALKEKKSSLYDEAAKSCPDPVGVETFRMLKAAEDDHLGRITAVYEEAKKGKVAADACQFHDFEAEDKKALLRKDRSTNKEKFEKPVSMMSLPLRPVWFLKMRPLRSLTNISQGAKDPVERDFLEQMIAEEREHHILLADLKFYYADTEELVPGERAPGAGWCGSGNIEPFALATPGGEW